MASRKSRANGAAGSRRATEVPRTIPMMTKLRRCAFCYAPSCTTKCSVCRGAYYCSAACQNKDWPTHRRGCDRPLTLDPEPELEHLVRARVEVGRAETFKTLQELCEALFKSALFHEAAAAARRWRSIGSPSQDEMRLFVSHLVDDGQWDEAKETIDEMRRVDPENAWAIEIWYLFYVGDYPRCLELLEKRRELSSSLRAETVYAQILIAHRSSTFALKVALHALSQFTNFGRIFTLLRMTVGSAQIRLGRLDDAHKTLREVIGALEAEYDTAEHPDVGETLLLLSDLAKSYKRPDLAVEFAEEALDIFTICLGPKDMRCGLAHEALGMAELGKLRDTWTDELKLVPAESTAIETSVKHFHAAHDIFVECPLHPRMRSLYLRYLPVFDVPALKAREHYETITRRLREIETRFGFESTKT